MSIYLNKLIQIFTIFKNLIIMKKIVIIMAISFISLNIFSQFSVGGKIGPFGIAYQTGSGNENMNILYSFQGGAVFSFQVAKWFALQTELNYERKGKHYSNEDISITFNKDALDLSYITIPLLMRFNTPGKVKFFGQLGPYLGILISAKARNRDNITYYVKDSYKTTDFGLAYGVGLLFPIANNLSMNLESRSSIGFINVYERNSYMNWKAHNVVWHLIFGVVYTIN